MTTLLDEVRSGLRQRQRIKGEWNRIAVHLGMSPKSLYRICDGSTVNPGVLTLERIAEVLRTSVVPQDKKSNSPNEIDSARAEKSSPING